MPIDAMLSFNVTGRGARPCFCRAIRSLYALQVFAPRWVSVTIPDPLAAVKTTPRETLQRVRINQSTLKAEIEDALRKGPLHAGKTLYSGLLAIKELRPDRIVIEQNQRYAVMPQILVLSTAENLRAGRASITIGSPDESVRELAGGDFNTCLRILSQNHPGEVSQALGEGRFEEVFGGLHIDNLTRILGIMRSGAQRLERALESGKLQEAFHFLPTDAQAAIIAKLFPHNEHAMKETCPRIAERLRHLGTAEREEVMGLFSSARDGMQHTLARLQAIAEVEEGASEERVRTAVLSWASAGIFSILEEEDYREITRVASEEKRRSLIEEIGKSNLVDNVKIPLLHILAERDFMYVSMFSFTSPLFAAAFTSSWLRGAEVKILLDKVEARQRSSQYDDLLEQSRKLNESYHPRSEFNVRTFTTSSQHLKNMLFGSGVVLVGSQNLSTRAFTANYEDVCIISGNRDVFLQKKQEFEEVFALQGDFVPLPAAVLSRDYMRRSGLVGIRFLDGPPPTHRVEDLLRQIAHLKRGDYRRLTGIAAIARGQRAELVFDLERAFHPFMAEIKDPQVLQVLLDFMRDVPAEFSMVPASSTEKFHPGPTTGIAGLVEHEFIVLELGIILCHILGREDLIDSLVLSGIAHDAYKDARRVDGGAVVWGGYNPEHGYVAAEQVREKAARLDGDPIYHARFGEACMAAGEHMSVWNKPAPTPLKPTDPTLKFILVLADMLASRKYMYSRHRVATPRSAGEILYLMLNNSFSIMGEALGFLNRDHQLHYFVAQSTARFGQAITDYRSVPRRAKKMLRVAESLCDLFELSQEDNPRRNEILTAALLFGTFRYRAGHEIGSPECERDFRKIMGELRAQYPDSSTAQGRVLELMERANQKLSRWDRAELAPADDPALWILCIANCMMTDPNTWIITSDEVQGFLEKVEIPKTGWVMRKLVAAKRQELTSQVASLSRGRYLHEVLPGIEEGLRTRFNYRRKNPLTHIHPEIVKALVDKYNCLFPSYIYEHFYLKRLAPGGKRTALVDRIREANTNREARRALVEEIRHLEAPSEPPPQRIYRVAAQAALANGIESFPKLVEKVIDPARDRESLRKYDYFPGIPRAVQHISGKLATQEKILVYGDYDMDGQAGTAILVTVMRRIRASALTKAFIAQGKKGFEARREAERIAEETIDYYIPHRLNEGYGLNEGALDRIHQRGYKLIVTNDCGTKDRALIARAARLGIDVVVTDHHLPSHKREIARDAVVIINPKVDLPKDHPAYYLSGAAVAYKLALALADQVGLKMGDSLLDLVACATIADVVPMRGENRAFVRYGFARLSSDKRNRGLGAVMRAERIEFPDEEAVAYFLVPRFNVLGRLGNASEGVRLLLHWESRTAREIIPLMQESLESRREIEDAILAEAEEKLSGFNPKCESGIAVAMDGHKGIIGLVSSELVRKYGVPAVVISTASASQFSTTDEPAYGSMRCIKGVSPVRILARCQKRHLEETGQPLFVSYGGHDIGAAGFKIKKERIPDFQRLYSEVCKEMVGQKRERMSVAATFHEGDITLEEVKLYRQLLGPFGSGFEDPLFYIPAQVESWREFGRDYQHLKGRLAGGTEFVIYNGNQMWIKRALLEREGEVKMVVRFGIHRYTTKGKERADGEKKKELIEKVVLIVEDIKI